MAMMKRMKRSLTAWETGNEGIDSVGNRAKSWYEDLPH